MNKRKKTNGHMVEIHAEQIIACLTYDAEIIIANVLADLKKGYYQCIEESLESLASLNRVLKYYGGAQVDFKMPKKYVKAIHQSMGFE
jgi:hypothetical protein